MSYKGGNLSLGAIQKVVVVTASTDESLPAGDSTFLLTCNVDMYVKWGIGAQTATTTTAYNLFMPAGLALIVDVGPADTIAGIRDTEDGVLSVTAVEGV